MRTASTRIGSAEHFENGHAFSSTIGARNYQLESRYERLIYWKPTVRSALGFRCSPCGAGWRPAHQQWPTERIPMVLAAVLSVHK